MHKPKTVLLVEDNSTDEMLILRVLEKAAARTQAVEVARDGQQAVDYLFQQGPFSGRTTTVFPAAVILDLGLPRLSGLEVLQRIRAHPRTRLLPVVVLTSSDDERDRMRSYENGANSFITKPVDFGEFVEKIGRLAAFWLGVNEPPDSTAVTEPSGS